MEMLFKSSRSVRIHLPDSKRVSSRAISGARPTKRRRPVEIVGVLAFHARFEFEIQKGKRKEERGKVQNPTGTKPRRYETPPVQNPAGTKPRRYKTPLVQNSAGTKPRRYKTPPVQNPAGCVMNQGKRHVANLNFQILKLES